MNDEFHLDPSATANLLPLDGLRAVPLREMTLSLLRAVAGFTLAIYGAQKLLGLFGAKPEAPFTLIWLAGILELVGGVLVGLGWFTRLAAFVLSGEMAVAFFLAHFPKGWNPVLNGGETCVLFSFIFLYLATAGPGAYSVEQILHLANATGEITEQDREH